MGSLQHESSPTQHGPVGADLNGVDLNGADLLSADRIGADRHLGVSEALADLFPERALVRGQIIRFGGDAARSLALASAARATADGSWLAMVAVDDLGVEAVGELGVDLTRMIVIETPCRDHRRWVDVVGAAADGCELVIAAVPPELSERGLRWVRQRLRSRGAILLVLADSDRSGRDRYSADLGFDVRTSSWGGLESGAGVLRARRVEVSVTGRRVHRPRTESYWLPGPDGTVGPVVPTLQRSDAMASRVS